MDEKKVVDRGGGWMGRGEDGTRIGWVERVVEKGRGGDGWMGREWQRKMMGRG